MSRVSFSRKTRFLTLFLRSRPPCTRKQWRLTPCKVESEYHDPQHVVFGNGFTTCTQLFAPRVTGPVFPVFRENKDKTSTKARDFTSALHGLKLLTQLSKRLSSVVRNGPRVVFQWCSLAHTSSGGCFWTGGLVKYVLLR